MCGIAGVYGDFSTEAKSKILDGFLSDLTHRGPDGSGTYANDEIGLIHTRLSIIDLSANGAQPLYSEDKSLVLICNGEIYNYQDIRNELLGKGHIFSSASDSEVIIHLYEEYAGDLQKTLDRLIGMFAFALWDNNTKKLVIARDRIGIKPLYYRHDGDKLFFASEVKPLILGNDATADIDYTSLYEYFLTGSIPAPNTLYAEVKCLEPGHYISAVNGKVSFHQYWDIPEGYKNWGSIEEITDKAETLLTEIVKDHLVADVPVGTFLSAGVDSSLITAIAAAHHPGIYSFTASFPGEPEDEGIIAADTAKKINTTHCAYELKGDFFKDFTSQFRNIDQPLAVSSALALGRISKMAKQKVKVVLSGDGADELFGGYSRHDIPEQPSFLKYIPAALQSIVLQAGGALTGKKSLHKLRDNLKVSAGKGFLNRIAIESEETVLSLFADDIKRQIDTGRFLCRLDSLFGKRKNDDQLNRILYVDMKTTLVDEMLTKCDRMTMMNGIEGRVPFLDHRFVSFAFSIPARYKRDKGIGKMILRRILAKKLGNELAYRVKTGFNSPLKQWLSKDVATIDFVKQELTQAGKLSFISNKEIQSYQADATMFKSNTIFSLICLNEFMKESNINSNKKALV